MNKVLCFLLLVLPLTGCKTSRREVNLIAAADRIAVGSVLGADSVAHESATSGSELTTGRALVVDSGSVNISRDSMGAPVLIVWKRFVADTSAIRSVSLATTSGHSASRSGVASQTREQSDSRARTVEADVKAGQGSFKMLWVIVALLVGAAVLLYFRR